MSIHDLPEREQAEARRVLRGAARRLLALRLAHLRGEHIESFEPDCRLCRPDEAEGGDR